jgi:outer membrane protein OmpA-like peptidoglycan-associated protein/tetratricopeptide (TPR) repeat protein
MKIEKINYTALLLLLTFVMSGQKTKTANADKKYDKYEYVDAIILYEKAAERGYKDEKILQRLANAYYFNAELPKAVKWYGQLFEMNPEQESEYLYRYAQSLKSQGNYSKADELLAEFTKKSASDKRGLLFENNKNYLSDIKTNSHRYEVRDAGINSEMADYGTAFLDNKVIFASARDTGGLVKNTFKWTNKAFTNLYSADLLPDGSLGKPKRFQKKINTKFNESTPVFTKDGKTMYFTRNNYIDGKRRKNDQKITLLKLFKATLTDNKWGNITELPFNSDQYSTAHPALSPDEKTLYFASDMPGTYGQSDLFKVTVNKDGSFGKPENLGPAINTEGRETFPFISEENELYFASDGRPGLGGLDVFVTIINSDLQVGAVRNVGEPINTKQDDFAFIINSKTREGFVSSNRENGLGFDDIYRFTEIKKLKCQQTLKGTIYDLATGEKLQKAKVILLDKDFNILSEVTSDDSGSYTFSELDCNEKFYVRVSNEDFETNESPVDMGEESGETVLDVKLQKRIKPIALGTDLAKTLEIPLIYFDLDKATIKKESDFHLEKIVAILGEYPNIKLEIRSHTDSRQRERYNYLLSDKRAKATMQWLISKGIDPARLTAKGFGETQLVNNCSDGVECTEDEHQLNRRSEFIIIGM